MSYKATQIFFKEAFVFLCILVLTNTALAGQSQQTIETLDRQIAEKEEEIKFLKDSISDLRKTLDDDEVWIMRYFIFEPMFVPRNYAIQAITVEYLIELIQTDKPYDKKELARRIKEHQDLQIELKSEVREYINSTEKKIETLEREKATLVAQRDRLLRERSGAEQGEVQPAPRPRGRVTYRLKEVTHGDFSRSPNWHNVVSLDIENEDSSGGSAKATVRFGNCEEVYQYTWEFDRDISELHRDDRFNVTASCKLISRSCANPDPSSLAVYGNQGAMISPVVADKLKGKRTRPGLSGGFGGLRGKVGPKEMTKEIVVDKNAEGPFQWFVVDVSAGHAAGSVRIHVIYLYMLL